MLTMFERRLRDFVVRRRRHDNRRRVDRVEQFLQAVERRNPELLRDRCRAIGTHLVETD